MSRFIDFKELKANVTMLQVLEHYQLLSQMQRSKEGYQGKCPFCENPSKRSLKINTEKNIFKCFAPGCGAKGNLLDFVARMENTSVRGAALKLTDWFQLKAAKPPQRHKRAVVQAEGSKDLQAEGLEAYFQTLWAYLEETDAPLAQYEALEALQKCLVPLPAHDE